MQKSIHEISLFFEKERKKRCDAVNRIVYGINVIFISTLPLVNQIQTIDFIFWKRCIHFQLDFMYLLIVKLEFVLMSLSFPSLACNL